MKYENIDESLEKSFNEVLEEYQKKEIEIVKKENKLEEKVLGEREKKEQQEKLLFHIRNMEKEIKFKEDIWVSQDNKVKKISELEDKHIDNILNRFSILEKRIKNIRKEKLKRKIKRLLGMKK